MIESDDPIIFVVPGDLHLTEADLDNHKVAHWVIGEVNNLIRPDFVQFIGDNIQDASEDQFRLFDDLRGRLAVPHFALVGDHDVKGDPEALGFRSRLGSTYGSSRLRGFRFVRLDTQQAKPLGISPGQIDWFRAEVDKASDEGERIVIFQHNYPYQIWESFDGPGVDDWRAIVQTRSIQAIICGHTHYGQVANDGRNVVVATRSIGDPEGGPPGYLLGYLRGEDFAFTYRSPEDTGPLILVTHPRESLLATGPTHIVSGPDQIRVKIWSRTPIVEVRAQLDEGDWHWLEPDRSSEWATPLPGDRLAKGTHSLTVEAKDRDGILGRRKTDFVVDPTGRYTAVPSAHPRVTETRFC